MTWEKNSINSHCGNCGTPLFPNRTDKGFLCASCKRLVHRYASKSSGKASNEPDDALPIVASIDETEGILVEVTRISAAIPETTTDRLQCPGNVNAPKSTDGKLRHVFSNVSGFSSVILIAACVFALLWGDAHYLDFGFTRVLLRGLLWAFAAMSTTFAILFFFARFPYHAVAIVAIASCYLSLRRGYLLHPGELLDRSPFHLTETQTAWVAGQGNPGGRLFGAEIFHHLWPLFIYLMVCMGWLYLPCYCLYLFSKVALVLNQVNRFLRSAMGRKPEKQHYV